MFLQVCIVLLLVVLVIRSGNAQKKVDLEITIGDKEVVGAVIDYAGDHNNNGWTFYNLPAYKENTLKVFLDGVRIMGEGWDFKVDDDKLILLRPMSKTKQLIIDYVPA